MVSTPPRPVRMHFSLDQQVRLLLVTPAPFRRWLRQDCGAIADRTGNPRECPVAQFLRRRLEAGLVPAVYADSVAIYGDAMASFEPQAIVPAPRWLHDFVRSVDRGPAAEGRVLLEPIPRDEALRTLERIRRKIDHAHS